MSDDGGGCWVWVLSTLFSKEFGCSAKAGKCACLESLLQCRERAAALNERQWHLS